MKIAVLGLGIIGSAWAKNLIADGHQVRCWNRTPKDFPDFCSSIKQAVDGAEFIIIVVADPPAVKSILDQIGPTLKAGQLVVQSSTISPNWTKIFAEQVKKTGADFLEAPFTGSKPMAEARKTVYYLGGDAQTVEKASPVLKSLSSTILHIGPIGAASTLKLAMNMNIAGIAQILCESLSLCRRAGISDDIYFNALANNVAKSGVSDFKGPKLRQGDYSPQFSLKHMNKDLRLALETADELSLGLSETKNLKNIYDQGMDKGWQDDDFIGLIRLLDK